MSWFSKLLFGVDVEEEAARGAKLDQRIHAQNQAALERGVWTPEQYEQAEANLAAPEAQSANAVEQVNAAFKEGAAEGLTAMQDAAKGATVSLAGFLPWWAWALAALFALAQLGILRNTSRRG